MLNQLISRIRRNHGLEHASIHVLSESERNFSAQGNSNHLGFNLNIYGDVPEERVIAAVHEAHQRMKAGQHELAVHPNCGTVLLTTATMSALAAQAAFAIEQRRRAKSHMDITTLLNALPSAILAVVVMLIISRPVGMHLQEAYTTDGDLGDLEIVSVHKTRANVVTRFFQLLLSQNAPATAYQVRTVN